MMDTKLKTTLWSSAGLLATLFIAWYFSRNNNGDVAPTDSAGVPPSISFGGTTIAPVTVTGSGSNSNPGTSSGQGSCCKNCNDSSGVSGGKILQSGSFTQETFAATKALVNTQSVQTASTAGTPIGIELIPQENGGMPLPSDSWWINDPTYRQAYVLSYNQTVGQLAQIIMLQKRPAISTMPMSFANNATPSAAESLAEKDGQTQLARGGHDQRWLLEAQNNSRLMMQTMSQMLGQWLQKLGDPHAASSGLTLPADQNVNSFLIN